MFEIRKEPENWLTYLPLQKKQEIAEHIAGNALARYHLTISYGDQELFDPVIAAEDSGRRARYLLGVLLKLYLGMDFESVEGEEYLLSEDDYDLAAAQHPMNTLERMKSDVKARDAVFDLLRDFKDLERMVNAELSGVIAARNDILPRLLEVLTATASPAALGRLSDMEQGIREQAKSIADAIRDSQAEIAASKSGKE